MDGQMMREWNGERREKRQFSLPIYYLLLFILQFVTFLHKSSSQKFIALHFVSWKKAAVPPFPPPVLAMLYYRYDHQSFHIRLIVVVVRLGFEFFLGIFENLKKLFKFFDRFLRVSIFKNKKKWFLLNFGIQKSPQIRTLA
jgi:hypothetical protein